MTGATDMIDSCPGIVEGRWLGSEPMTLRKNTLLPAESRGEMGSTEDDRSRRYLDACRAVADGMGWPPRLEKVATDVFPRMASALGADGGDLPLG